MAPRGSQAGPNIMDRACHNIGDNRVPVARSDLTGFCLDSNRSFIHSWSCISLPNCGRLEGVFCVPLRPREASVWRGRRTLFLRKFVATAVTEAGFSGGLLLSL